MALLAFGLILVMIGAASIRYLELAQGLAREDQKAWRQLGAPGGHGFFDLGGTLALHNWIIVRGYEKSASKHIQALGLQARMRAVRARFTIYCGLGLMGAGFIAALFG